MIFHKPRSYPIFLVIPESFLTLILCPFWHEHTCSVSYQKDPALFDSFKIPHEVVVVVSFLRFDTVWALEITSLFKINFFLRPSRVSTIKLTYAPAGKVENYPLCCDDKLRSLFATWTSGGFVTVVARNGLKTIQGLVLRMVLLFQDFSWKTPNIYVSMEQKICIIVNISWWVKCDGNSTNVIEMFVLSVFFG